jgi:hypothetical protein
VSRGGLLAFSCLAAVFGFSWAAAAGSAAPLTFPTEACPVHGRIESSVSYACAAEFTLPASNGYRITVSADPEGRSDGVELTVAGHGANVQYIVPGKAGADTIKARFGDLGEVSVRFHASGRERDVRVPKKCMKERPRVVTSRLGRFVGTIKFRGEGGYTQVSARSAQGGTGDPLTNTAKKLQCEFRESEAERRRELESVSLEAAPPRAGIFFNAGRLFGDFPALAGKGKALPPKGDRYLFFVLAGERVGQMSIIRTTGAIGDAQDFLFDDALASATVRPPAPFTGSGSYLRNADGSTSWTGNLSVPVPGLGTVGLTGGTADLATVATRLERFEEEQKGVRRPASARRARR